MPGKRPLPDPPRSSALLARDSLRPSGTAYEADALSRGFRRIAGVDEAGRGPLAGPVVAGAVVFDLETFNPDIRDSKLLSPKKRERLATWVKDQALSWAVGVADSREIDKFNILRASLLAMARAVGELSIRPDFLIIDGPYEIPSAILLEDGAWPTVPVQRTVKGGDRLCFSIAAASIIAKVARDRMMVELDALYPEYGFVSHKGYLSRRHAAALDRHGPSPVHRYSFKPVRESLKQMGPPDVTARRGRLPVSLFGAKNGNGR